ncbi:putative lipid II flippase FtsW [uncultured Pseudokineococcus sp.]|uniref:putative lipid II flippase FtsW n=1 Tax=uncultured Pseudokineococcus sp. TaxID=1642928 RepID=UPI00260B9AD7|nr:putative lipid II flippase FtsW [uncultured Pseudokineococcus sp.]
MASRTSPARPHQGTARPPEQRAPRRPGPAGAAPRAGAHPAPDLRRGAPRRALERAGDVVTSWVARADTPATSFYLLSATTGILVVLGLVMVLSSSSVESLQAGDSPFAAFTSQLLFAVLGLPLAYAASRVPVRVWKALAWPAVGLAAVLQLLVFSPLGDEVGGNRNWIYVGGFSLQPSEFAKLALAVWLGAVLVRKAPLLRDWKHVAVPVVPVAGGVLGLVLLGHDLGTGMVVMLVIAAALWVAGVPAKILLLPAAALAAVAAVMVLTSPNRMTRIGDFLSGECDPQGGCYQSAHGLMALAGGGVTGLGLGSSREKWSYLPEAHNDFIFSIIGEELGLLGTLLVLVLFGALAVGCMRVIKRHEDPFAKVVTAGVMAWVVGQALVNMAVVLGLVPVIGVPLPLVSAGGSALVATLLALGVVLSFARTEPGAPALLATRAGVVRRSLVVAAAPLSRRSAGGPTGRGRRGPRRAERGAAR